MMSPTRRLVPLVLVVAATLPVAGCAGDTAPVARPAAAADVAPAGGPEVEALGVLHAWDARRLRAWRAGDPAALRALYAPGSASGRADLRLLRAYADRGLVVQDLRTQVFTVDVLDRSPVRLRLRVTDRVAGGTALRGGRPVTLPATAPVVRTVELVRGGATSPWRVREATRPG